MPRRIDLTNHRFDQLLVLEEFGRDSQGNIIWKCLCDCNNITYVSGVNLRKGNTRSCGCFKKYNATKPFNQYEFAEELNCIKVYDNHGRCFLIDEIDLPLVSQYRWAQNGKGQWYNKNKTLLYRLLLNPSSHMVVDHINGDNNDNRRSNLRIVTKAQNNINISTRKESTSGVKGISLARSKWYAYINYQNKRYNLGYYDSIEEATYIRYVAEQILFGEFSEYVSRNLPSPNNPFAYDIEAHVLNLLKKKGAII